MKDQSVGLIHATVQSIQPIAEAFRSVDPAVSLLHFADEGLLFTLQKEGQLTASNTRRLCDLIAKAESCGVGCIQLTCSAFNHKVEVLQPLFGTKIFRSDEAMLDEALNYERVGIVSSVEETPPVLIAYLKDKKPGIATRHVVDREAFKQLNDGNRHEHDKRILDLVCKLEHEVDVIVLSQYSMAHVKPLAEKEVKTPVVSAPLASAMRCQAYLSGRF
jgi:Asp/Glu/hydantoin racemase